MWQYILKRLLLVIPTLIGIITVCFLFTQLVPGGPVEQIMAQIKGTEKTGGEVSLSGRDSKREMGEIEQEQIDFLKKQFGFDKPLYVQYWNWLKRLFVFDLGESYFLNKRVTTLIKERLPVSASLGILGFLISYLISIPLGIAKSVRAGTRFDLSTGLIVLTAYSIPGFVLAVFLLILFGGGSFFDLFPLRGLTSDHFAEMTLYEKVIDYLWHLVLPITCYAINSFAWLTLLTRNLFLDELNQLYVTTARAKGLSEKVILWKHVFRNAMIIVIAGIPAQFVAMFFVGSLLIETVFSLDGLGLLSYQSIIRRDYGFFISNVYLFSVIGLLMKIVSDLMLVLIDPRITFDKVQR